MAEHAFSEHVTAGPSTREHISPVGPEGLKLGGGAPRPLCYREKFAYWQGWHVQRTVTLPVLAKAKEQGWVCLACAALYEEEHS